MQADADLPVEDGSARVQPDENPEEGEDRRQDDQADASKGGVRGALERNNRPRSAEAVGDTCSRSFLPSTI